MSDLHDAYERIKSGDKSGARNLLKDYLKENPQSPNGWWLMYNALENEDQRDKALDRVLKYQPDHKQALKALAKREAAQQSTASSYEADFNDFGFESAAGADSGSTGGKPKKKKSGGGGGVALAIILGGLGICVVIPIVIIVVLALLGPAIGEQFESIITMEAGSASSVSGADYIMRGNITVGQTVGGNVDTFDDDGWRFQGNSGQSITVDVVSTSDLDPQLYVYGPDGGLVAENDDISMIDGNMNSRVSVSLPANGDYTFVVSAFGSGGSYEISVR